MLLPHAVERLAALAHPSRLAIFRLLIRAGSNGVAAGDIAREIGVRANTLSAQLTLLATAGLVHARREGRSIIYAADFTAMQELLTFLVDDCCGGRPEICAPLADLARLDRCTP